MRFYHHLLFAVFAALSLPALGAEPPGEEAVLKKGGAEAAALISKARDILSTAEVFATRVVNEPAVPTSSCWALTVIVRYDPKAREFLNALFESPKAPEQRLYAIAGLVTLDAAEKKRFGPAEIGAVSSPPVQTQFGKMKNTTDLPTATYMLLQQGTPYYFFPQLPPLSSTVNVTREPEAKK
ncbi:hypothetical protein [Prosthecobacter sp.]|uniref:hypothetical protein n=1 Tax=Prosthecobacter sp. TaxID=1965333 RepID=UPI003783B49E